MKPIPFPEANKTLQKPQGMTDDECDPLPVFNDGRLSISCWKMGWHERLAALFFGRVWLFVYFGASQPPVGMEVMKTVFKEADHVL